MCGINGFSWSDQSLIEKMNKVIKNRGPDDQGFYLDDNITLGNRRLAIIDLSELGHMPMTNEDGSIWITYNGEIYNYHKIREELIDKGHIFKSDSDTEVIIHGYEQYGLDIFKKLNGMWALCLYDVKQEIIILCRDQFGIKPLYYYIDDKGIIFSSMISAILCYKNNLKPNNFAIMEYLEHNLEDYKEFTFFEDIYKLETDKIMIYDLKNKSYSTKKWYELKNKEKVSIQDIKDSFIESIKYRTISDVPVGSCLSGGVDSSSIVVILNEILKTNFYTFSFIAPGSRFDESNYIKEVGRKTNTNQFFTELNIDEFLSEIEDFVICQEEPVTGLSPYAQYRVMKLAHEHNLKVLLDGQGSDEIFAGYIYYFAYYYYELLSSLKLYTLLKETILYIINFKNIYPHKMFFFLLLPNYIKKILWKSSNNWVNYDYIKLNDLNISDPRWEKMGLKESLNLTLFSTAIPHLLRWEDKNSMRWSIESRPPFLDINIVENALSSSSEQKLKNGKTKRIFRSSIEEYLPDLIKNRTDKIGFEVQVNEFIREEKINAFFENIINSDSFKNRPYWKWEKISKLYQQHKNKKINIGDTIWKWINLEIWLRNYFPNQ
jgi:asparagine synthase (glutamine-hydrolysing)